MSSLPQDAERQSGPGQDHETAAKCPVQRPSGRECRQPPPRRPPFFRTNWKSGGKAVEAQTRISDTAKLIQGGPQRDAARRYPLRPRPSAAADIIQDRADPPGKGKVTTERMGPHVRHHWLPPPNMNQVIIRLPRSAYPRSVK